MFAPGTVKALQNHYKKQSCKATIDSVTGAAPLPLSSSVNTPPHPLPSSNPGPTAVSPDDDGDDDEPSPYASPQGEDGELVEDPILKGSGFIINQKYSLLICTACEYAVRPSEASNHIKTQHANGGLAPLPALNLRSSCEKFDISFPHNSFPKPTTIIPPVAGIKLVNGFVCEGCGYAVASYPTMTKHIRTSHDKHEAPNIRGGAVLQMAFGRGGEGHSYYEVERARVHTVVPHLGEARGIIHEALKKNRMSVKSDHLQDARDRPIFLKTLRWDTHVEPFEPSTLFALAAAPNKSEPIYTKLKAEIIIYIKKSDVHGCPDEILQDLVSGDVNE